jgi:hypothetical protein
MEKFTIDYQLKLYSSLQNTKYPTKKELHRIVPAINTELYARMHSNSFDEGRTQQWISHLGKNATTMTVKDTIFGHTIHVLSDRSSKELIEEIEKGIHILRWMSEKPVTWFWWDHNWKRILPRNTNPGKEYINGGWAIPGVPEVHVYRREEAHKVLIHETIHAIQLDIPHHSIPPVLHRFESDLQRKLWPHLGEAYTEFYAEFLWAVYVASSLENAQRNWQYQLQCSELQAAQIGVRIAGNRTPEDTNVFAYYILKWVLMQHTSEVLLSPVASLQKWFVWWKEAEPTLYDLIKKQKLRNVQEKDISLGMTCGLTVPSE